MTFHEREMRMRVVCFACDLDAKDKKSREVVSGELCLKRCREIRYGRDDGVCSEMQVEKKGRKL